MRRQTAMALSAVILVASCDRGDWFPPERTIREVLFAWDMWSTDSVRPYEGPMPATPEGAVRADPTPGFAEAKKAVDSMDEATRTARAKVAYRRYCHHCHGPSGDGRIIVGESFDVPPPDLRSESAQSWTDEEMFDLLSGGTVVMIPLTHTLSATEMVLAIHHVRTLPGAPSVPYFSPKNATPIE